MGSLLRRAGPRVSELLPEEIDPVDLAGRDGAGEPEGDRTWTAAAIQKRHQRR